MVPVPAVLFVGGRQSMSTSLHRDLGLSSFPVSCRSLQRAWPQLVSRGIEELQRHGKLGRYLTQVDALEPRTPRKILLSQATPQSIATQIPDAQECEQTEQSLRALYPWRKGPFELDGVYIDSEWRSDLKWERVRGLVPDWSRRSVLDVGTGNGYFLLRALGEGAESVLGVEPGLHSVAQYLALQRYFPNLAMGLLPLPAESFLLDCQAFDIVLSMGVLYHRRSPFDHLQQLRGFMKEDGRLLLETLVVDGPLGHCLVPEGRYAQMRNVWFLPSRLTLESWLRKMRLKPVAWSEPSYTNSKEQRATSWTQQPSLSDFLNPEDRRLTIEGHPAPCRLMVLCEAT